MSETPDQDNKVQEPEPEHAEAGKDEAQAAPARKRSHKRQQHRQGIVWLLLLVIGTVAGGVFYGAQLLTASRDQLNRQVSELQQQQQAMLEDAQTRQQKASEQFTALQKNQEELSKYIEVLRESNKHLRKDWLILEAEYLIQLANYRLLFERDINTAIVALNSADTRLRETGDPALLNIRKAIAESTHALKQIEQVDLAGLSLTLTALNRDLDKLPLNTPDPVAKANEASDELTEAKQVSSWKDLPAAIWRDIRRLVVIRDHEQPVAPLLSPEQRFFLVENLRLQLEQARLAMLSGQAQVYHERISTAIGWIEEHFDKEALLTKNLLDSLRQLKTVAIAPELPDISAAYHALQKYRGGGGAQENKQAAESPASENSGNGSK